MNMLSCILAWFGFGRKPQPRQTAPSRPGSAGLPGSGLVGSQREPQGDQASVDREAGSETEAAGPARSPTAATTPAATVASGSREIELVAGIDLGTSCTKIVVRFPYDTGQPTYALPVPPDRQAESHPYLWLSELWLVPDGTFDLVPKISAEQLTGLKWKLMQWPELRTEPSTDPTPIEAASAFLALQMRRTRNWLTEKRPDLASKRYVLRWSWHIGFPAPSLDDIASRKRYEVCFSAAFNLAGADTPLTLMTVREAVVRAAEASAARLQETGLAIFPEIAAAVAGFAHSSRHEDGLYAMMDVGAATLDCCTFNLVRKQTGLIRCPIFAADVALLGVELSRCCDGEPFKAAEFRNRLDWQPRAVIWRTRASRYKSSPRWEHGLPLFLIGGGRASEPHLASAESLSPWLRRHLGADRYPHAAVRIAALPAPELIEYEGEGCGTHRLAVAVGLSLPPDQIPDIELPGTIPDEPKPPTRDISRAYPDKAQT